MEGRSNALKHGRVAGTVYFERHDFAHRSLCHWLDRRGPTSVSRESCPVCPRIPHALANKVQPSSRRIPLNGNL